MASAIFALGPVQVDAPNVTYGPNAITATVAYTSTAVRVVDSEGGRVIATPATTEFVFQTVRTVPRLGVMIVGLGGNNGTTVVGGLLANKAGMTWRAKAAAAHRADYVGSLTQASTVRLGSAEGRDVYVPFSALLPMVHPNDLAVGGWDISGAPLGAAMERAGVFDYDLQRQLRPAMDAIVPLPSVYYPDFIAANQADRADNLLPGNDKAAHLAAIRGHIAAFKAARQLDKVVVLWSANTERYSAVVPGVNDTEAALLGAIQRSEAEVAPSTVFAVAALLEGCAFINGSPQNTMVPGVLALAQRVGCFVGGDDFKSGQTKMKSVLVDFLIGAGIKPISIVSMNHLGNNDGKK